MGGSSELHSKAVRYYTPTRGLTRILLISVTMMMDSGWDPIEGASFYTGLIVIMAVGYGSINNYY